MNTMKQNISYLIIGLAVIGAGAGVYALNHQSGKVADTANETPQSSPSSQITTAMADIAAAKATLIDVRTPEEFAAGHAKDAVNLNSVDIQAGKLPQMAKDTKIYLYCRTGHRAGLVLPILKEAGFTDVTNLGGFQAWLDAGGPRA